MELLSFRTWNKATNEAQYEVPTDLPPRPKVTTTLGREVAIKLNSYSILKYPDKTIYQYDVQIGGLSERRALIKKVWSSKTVAGQTGKSWIFDGNKIAWSLDDKFQQQKVFLVDLDAEEGITPREGRENIHRVVIRKTSVVHLAALKAYLAGQVSFDSSILSAINFLDHLLRQHPSTYLTAIRQSFFAHGYERFPLGKGVEAFKGIYQTIRACQGGRLAVNADVSNGTFWIPNTVLSMAQWLTGAHGRSSQDGMLTMAQLGDLAQFLERIKDVKVLTQGGGHRMESSYGWRELKRMRKLNVQPKYGDEKNQAKRYKIEAVIRTTAKDFKFKVRDRVTKVESETNVFDYFLRAHNYRIVYPQMPLVQTNKKGVVMPMECLWVSANQKYPYKLDETQTAEMIKFAVTRPEIRQRDIKHGLGLLDWPADPFLRNYGMQIDTNMVTTKARVLPPPTVQFGGTGKATPAYSGRWDLKGQKFLLPNTEPLKAWGVCIITSKHRPQANIQAAVVRDFLRALINSYIGHGGRVENKEPFVIEAGGENAANAVEVTYQGAGNQSNKRPQLLFFVLPSKDTPLYLRIKRSCDCRYGVVSQCVQAAQVFQKKPQYLSNVCMKVNAKLGGTTARVAGKDKLLGHFSKPTIVIGADVSHGAAGTEQASLAAMTVSLDRIGVRYGAAVETNGIRTEMITTSNIKKMIMPLVTSWIMNVNGRKFPEHVYYFRDGVSEGQYAHVLNQEVRDIRLAFQEKFPDWKPKLVVVVASKRHHIRFFPTPGDRMAADKNGNPLPGTLVERDVTHPRERDAYLCAHMALQGTARPVHYHVLMDEAGLTENQLYSMIYEQCYSYIRSTTSVSLHPAVYYAHLASNRAKPHEKDPPELGKPSQGAGASTHSSGTAAEPSPLLPMPVAPNGPNINETMWFV
ncbi:MAG: hypothetical protein M1838_001912 [Thelocarpon superellum]|nr:MAG: hypothetical protein M1838_001912 [Thelocarpon superellum]